MKQCINCKKIIDDDDVICPNCGKNPDELQVDNDVHSLNQMGAVSINNVENDLDLTSKLSKAYSIVKSAYDSFAKAFENGVAIKNEKSSGDVLTAKGFTKTMVKGLIGLGTGNSNQVAEAIRPIVNNSETFKEGYKKILKNGTQRVKLLIPFIISVIIIFNLPDNGFLGGIKRIAFSVWVIAFLVVMLVASLQTAKELFTRKNDYKNYTKEYEDNYYSYMIKASKILKDNEKDLAFIPKDYWYPEAIEYMLKMAKQSIVTNISDALKKCDEYINKESLDSSEKENIKYSKDINDSFISGDNSVNYQYVNDERYYKTQLESALNKTLGVKQ